MVEAEFAVMQIVKLIPLIATISAACLCLYLYHIVPAYTKELQINFYKLYVFLNGKYFVDVVYNYYSMYKGLNLGYLVSKILDRGLIELSGPFGLEKGLYKSSQDIAKVDSQNLTIYALYITIQIVCIIFILFQSSLLHNTYFDARLIFVLVTTAFIANINVNK